MKLKNLFTHIILIVAFANSLGSCESKGIKSRMDSLYDFLILENEMTRLSDSQDLLSFKNEDNGLTVNRFAHYLD